MGKYEEFARWLRIELAKRGWKGSDLVREFQLLGESIADGTVSKWRHGGTQPTRENCAILADIFDVPVADILVLAEHEPIETAGPLSGLSRRLADLPIDARERVAAKITTYGNALIDLSRSDAAPQRILADHPEVYGLDERQSLMLMLEQLDADALLEFLDQAQEALQKQSQ